MRDVWLKQPRLVAVLMLILTASAFFIGSAMTRGALQGESGAPVGERMSFLRALFGRTFSIPGRQQGQNFVLSNFESETDLQVWELKSARMEIVRNGALEGEASARVTFYAGEYAGISVEDYFTSRGGQSDWSGFESLAFIVFNSNDISERIIFQLKDKAGSRFKKDFLVGGGERQVLQIPISEISSALNIRKIDQLSIFVWGLAEAKEFYFDDLELLASGDVLRVPEKKGRVTSKDRPVKRVDYGFSLKKPAWEIKDLQVLGKVIRVPFIVVNETQANCILCPVEGGIPLPLGELKSTENIRLRNDKSEELPYQARVLSRWADGSIKWLGLHFVTTVAAGTGVGFFLDYGPHIEPQSFTGAMHLTETDDSWKVHTGKLEAHLSKKDFYLFDRLYFDRDGNGVFGAEEEVSAKAPFTLKFRGEEYRGDLDKKSYRVEVEEQGDRRIVMKASGWFQSEKGKRFCQAIVRTTFYEGQSYVKVAHTLVFTGTPENKIYEPYKKIKLPQNEAVQAFGLKLPVRFSNAAKTGITIGRSDAPALGFSGGEPVRLLQLDWDHAKVLSAATSALHQDNFSGWVDFSDDTWGVTVAVRNFRENFPKAIGMDSAAGELKIDLWPEEAGEINLSTSPEALGPEDYARGSAFGLAKTHEIFLDFHGPLADRSIATDRAAAFKKRLLIRTNPYWMDATGALGRLYPVDSRYATEERMLEKIFDWAERQPRNFRWYGMLNFGDTLTWHRSEDDNKWYEEPGWNPVGRWGWYNCEGVGTHTGALLQFARSGHWKYFEFGENLARHLMDVDTVHFDTIRHDPRLKKLDPKMSQPGAMHRHSADHWSGRTDEASHTSVVGLLHYYHLTGDERAWEVVKEIGEFFLTEPFTYIGHPDIAPHRALANALWGDVLLFEATGDQRYKKAADKIIEIYLAGQEPDGSFLENFNPETGTWSGEKHLLYMEGYALGAFMAYHEMTQDDEVKEMILKMIRFLEPHEFSGPAILHGLAYAYMMTRDFSYLDSAERYLKYLVSHQQASQDPLKDGLIYEKPIYHCPMTFLSTMPYIFGALEEGFRSTKHA